MEKKKEKMPKKQLKKSHSTQSYEGSSEKKGKRRGDRGEKPLRCHRAYHDEHSNPEPESPIRDSESPIRDVSMLLSYLLLSFRSVFCYLSET